MKYRQLNIAEAKQLLRAGREITCAEGFRMFPHDVQHSKCENMHSSEVSWPAFRHLQEHGFIELDDAKSKLTGYNQYAVWRASAKLKQDIKHLSPIVQDYILALRKIALGKDSAHTAKWRTKALGMLNVMNAEGAFEAMKAAENLGLLAAQRKLL